MKLLRLMAIASLLFVFAQSNALGQSLLFDNGVGGAANVDDGYSSDAEIDLFGADDFRMNDDCTVTDITFSGIYAFGNTAPATDDMTINFYSGIGGIPGAILGQFLVGDAVNRVDSGFDDPILGFDIYEYSVTISGFDVDANTDYWLGIHGNTTNDPDDDWLWGIINGAGNSTGSNDGGFNFDIQEDHQMDFRLLGDCATVPEPSGLSLFGLLVFTLRRKRKSVN